MRMRILRVMVGALMLIPALGAGSTASAAPADLDCLVTATLHFSPGVNLTSRSIQITGSSVAGNEVSTLTPCSSPLSGVPYLGNHGLVTGSGTIACLPVGLGGFGGLAGTINATLPVTWDNGDVSVITLNVVVVGPVPVITASVTGGRVQGATVAAVPVLTGLTGNCVLTPVTSLSLAMVVTFVGL
jgi:hypothetical protein